MAKAHDLNTQISDNELLKRLRNYEDNFVERKPNGDKAGWLHTAVAFANAVPIGYPAVLFVGVDNKGNPQQNGDLESLQKTVHIIRKGQVRWLSGNGIRRQNQFINELFEVAA